MRAEGGKEKEEYFTGAVNKYLLFFFFYNNFMYIII